MSSLTTAVQAFSITISLAAAGSIATLSVFDVQEMKSQPAERSLPMIRWLFSRGSHTYPAAAFMSGAGFAFLAYNAIPPHLRSILQLLKTSNGMKVNGYVAATVLSLSIGLFTAQVMVPNNFALIEKNEAKGGARSAKSAAAMREQRSALGGRSAEESVEGKGDVNEFTDLSGPQGRTERSFSAAEQREVDEMLTKFSRQNLWRAVLLGAGGVVGLLSALA